MTWTAFHHRGDVLRTVMDAADERRDGILPTDVSGVAETFADETDLVGALQMHWYTRLSGRIERELGQEPLDPAGAVIAGWRQSAAELPGTRAVLDRSREQPGNDATAEAMRRATHKEHVTMASLAGRGGHSPAATARQGRALEGQARSAPAAPRPGERENASPAAASGHTRRVLDRLRAALVA